MNCDSPSLTFSQTFRILDEGLLGGGAGPQLDAGE